MLPALALLPLLTVSQEPALDDKHLEGLSEAIGAYLEARDGAGDIEAARTAVRTSLEETLPNGPPLRAIGDLERAVQLARAGDRKVRTGKVTDDMYVGGAFQTEGLAFTYRVPRDYDPRSSSYPLILAIPEPGETPADHLRSSWSSKPVREQAIVVALRMPEDPDDWNQVMVYGLPGGLCHILTGARVAAERFAVDPDRVFVAGRGKGVAAAMTAGDTEPQRFAGIVGRAGDAAELLPDNFGNLPVYLIGGGARATAFAEAFDAAGLDGCELLAQGGEDEAWRWMSLRRRDPAPRSVRLAVGEPFPVRSGWLRVTPSEVKPRVRASLDRSSNTVRIEAFGASRAILHLNDHLLDLDRPVKVIANGETDTTLVRRNLSLTLDRLVDGTSDPGCVYTAELVVDLGDGPLWPANVPPAADPEFEARLAAAEGSVEQLWQLYEWCHGSSRAAQAVSSLKRILRLEPDHREAREALGHRWSRVQWFTSQAALDRFTSDQEPGPAAARGWVEYQALWMHPDERARLSKGLEKDHESGEWLSSAERKRRAAGWERQDLAWIEPEQTALIDQGLWRVDGEWVDLATADRRRAVIGSMWHIPGLRVRLHTTCDREAGLRARVHMERAIDDMRKVFGAAPALPLDVTLLRSEEQFDRFAFGDPDGRRRPSHVGRLHLIHNGYFAESLFVAERGRPSYRGMGVGLWDTSYPSGEAFGVHSARVAAGLSYVDALDPSPKAHRLYPSAEYYGAFEEEKQLPRWLRWGGAVYAERFYEDGSVPPGGDPWWARRWSIENLDRLGGRRPLEVTLAFDLDPDQRNDTQRLLIEAGLAVAFMVDGGCAQLEAAHQEFKRALATGRLRRKHLEDLTEALLANEPALHEFAYPAEDQ